MASLQHQKGPLPPFQIRPIPRIFFPPKTVSFFTLGDLRTLLGYHSLISGSYRGPFARWLPRPPASRKGIRRRRDGEADDDQRILLHQFNQLEGF